MEKQKWLDSDSFVKRAFAVYGYCLAAVGMMYLAFLLVFVLIGGVAAFFGAF